MQSAYVCGELWVSYHVRLSRPVLANLDAPMDLFASRGVVTAAAWNDPANSGRLLGSNLGCEAAQYPDALATLRWCAVLPYGKAYYLAIAFFNTNGGWPPVGGTGAIGVDGSIGTGLALVNGLSGTSAYNAMHDSGGGELATQATLIYYDGSYDTTADADRRARAFYCVTPDNAGHTYDSTVNLYIIRVTPGIWNTGMPPSLRGFDMQYIKDYIDSKMAMRDVVEVTTMPKKR
jgi:hypothetical protein